ncbi:protein mono-ADP-ribosyltransferase PARP4 [Gastrophryne carolinensis]
MGVAIFSDCVFLLKVNSLPFKEKSHLKTGITSNGGAISFVLNEKCTHVVVDGAAALNGSQQKRIQKNCITVVNPDYIWKSIQANQLFKPELVDNTLILDATRDESRDVKRQQFLEKFMMKPKSGFTEGEHQDDEIEEEDCATGLPPDTEVAKYSFFQKGEEIGVVEMICFNEQHPFAYKISTTCGVPGTSEREFSFNLAHAAEKACEKYEQRIKDLKKKSFKELNKIPPEAECLTSPALQKVLLGEALNVTQLSPKVCGFVDSIWSDANIHLKCELLFSVETISLNDVSKAEGILQSIRIALNTKEKPENIREMMQEFYQCIPHKRKMLENIDKKFLTVKQDLCQLIRDMLNVFETTSSRPYLSYIAKYRALRCRIEYVDPDTAEFQRVSQEVLANNHSDEEFKILRVFRIGRLIEAINFKSDLGNIRSLLHASPPTNFVGILSRGLQLPKMIVDQFGLERTDIGNLGSGIYFSDSISTSVKYTATSRNDKPRLLVVCDVALGQTKDVFKRNYSITEPPEGFHSLHGVRCDTQTSDFTDDEYVVYNVNQVKMRYIVQFCNCQDNPQFCNEPDRPMQEDDNETEACEPSENLPIEDLPEAEKIKGGLQAMDGQQIPLESIHVKARLMDLAAQVVIFQTYKNNSLSPIEAKYVFPLDSTAAVCGFEAFINGKHIVGEVKEKQQAHREYRSAISEGHGAYLMDQAAPDVFTVSVGNLPAKATVIIKITYVTELECPYSTVHFSIPGAVASWQEDQALKENTQDTVEKVGIDGRTAAQGSFSLDMSIEMPRKIQHIWCDTHDFKVKRTECKAVMQVRESHSWTEFGFSLSILLEEGYIPRMWVETHPEQDSEACMLIFRPEFDSHYEQSKITICLDCSNSMESCFQSAKRVALLALSNLSTYHINIVTFGSNYKELYFYPKSLPNDLSEVEKFIKGGVVWKWRREERSCRAPSSLRRLNSGVPAIRSRGSLEMGSQKRRKSGRTSAAATRTGIAKFLAPPGTMRRLKEPDKMAAVAASAAVSRHEATGKEASSEKGAGPSDRTAGSRRNDSRPPSGEKEGQRAEENTACGGRGENERGGGLEAQGQHSAPDLGRNGGDCGAPAEQADITHKEGGSREPQDGAGNEPRSPPETGQQALRTITAGEGGCLHDAAMVSQGSPRVRELSPILSPHFDISSSGSESSVGDPGLAPSELLEEVCGDTASPSPSQSGPSQSGFLQDTSAQRWNPDLEEGGRRAWRTTGPMSVAATPRRDWSPLDEGEPGGLTLRNLLQSLATKEDLQALPSKTDLESMALRIEKAVRKDIEDLQQQTATLDTRVTAVERSREELSRELSELAGLQREVRRQQKEMQLHLDDLENRGRRNNVKLRGIPEEMGGDRLRTVAQSIFNSLLDRRPETTYRIERIHRVMSRPQGGPGSPRDVLCRLLSFEDREEIVKTAWERGTVNWNGTRITILPDFSRRTLHMRRLLRPLLEKIKSSGASYKWGHPFHLVVRKNDAVFALRSPDELPRLFDFLSVDAIQIPDWLTEALPPPFQPLPQRERRFRFGGVGNGTRQGCPLSPLLFVLVMEHLAVAMRRNPDIKGVDVGNRTHKLALYADDLLMYVTSPHISLPSIIHEFQRFSRVSNFKVNMAKSEILNISIEDRSLVQRLKGNFSFKWREEAMNYLGVSIPADPTLLFRKNYDPLLARAAKPNMGSTEFWKPLHSISLLRPSTGYQKILLISDGHLQNEENVFQILKKHKNHIKLFTCGIGSSSNKHILRCLANRGSGAFEYFADKSKSSWTSQMSKQCERLQSPAYTAISVKWRQFERDPPAPVQAPANIPSLFSDENLFVYGFVSHCTQATLKAFFNTKEFENMVSTTALQKTRGTILHKLTARALIKDYEDGILREKEHENELEKQKMKSFIIKLSKEHSIVTQFTSFVAIEKRGEKESENIEPDIDEILSTEEVDILPYMEYTDGKELMLLSHRSVFGVII